MIVSIVLLAAVALSGVGVVILVPPAWTALFHRGWESACVVVAIVADEAIVSVTQSAGAAVTVRRVVLWAMLGALIAVVTHGLRDRISRSQRENAELAERLGELGWSRTAIAWRPTCRARWCSGSSPPGCR